MIKIQFPLSENFYTIDASEIVEKHLLEKFFPYSCIFKKTEQQPCELAITVQENIVEIRNRKGNLLLSKHAKSAYDSYRIIIETLRDHATVQTTYTMMHASFIKFFEKGFLFLGESGAGKSTLSAFLHHKENVQCYADDIVYIDYKTDIASYSSQFLHLRPASLPLLPTNINAKYDSFLERYKIAFPTNRFPCQIDLIFVLKRENVSDPFLSKPSDPFFSVMQNMYLPYSLRNNLKATMSLLSTNEILEMHYEDLNSMYNMLLARYT